MCQASVNRTRSNRSFASSSRRQSKSGASKGAELVRPSAATLEAEARAVAAAAGKAALEATVASRPAFSVPLLRVVQFLRQSGIMPRVLPRLVGDLYDEAMQNLRKVPNSEMVPWWWSRDRSKPQQNIMFGLGAFRNCPETVDLLQQAVVMVRSGLFCSLDTCHSSA